MRKPLEGQSSTNKTARAFIGSLALLGSSTAHALSVGTPQFDSFLLEPLQLRIPVSDSERPALVNDPGNFLDARLLPNDEYGRFQLEPPAHAVGDFRIGFAPSDRDDGFWLTVQTRTPIREPVLSLVLELRHDNEILLKQIDIVLDPRPAAVTRARPTPAPTPRLSALERLVAEHVPENEPQPTAPRLAAPPPEPVQVIDEPPAQRSYGPVRYGESISRIAQRVRPDPGISLERMIAALRRANPEAFFGDLHELKVGATLQVPDAEEIRAVPAAAAEGWREPPRATEVAATQGEEQGDQQRVVAAAPAPRAAEPEPRARRAGRGRVVADAGLLARDIVYLEPGRYALAVQFDSYAALKAEQEAQLAKIEAEEPPMFRVDWTMPEATAVASAEGAAQTAVATEPPAATATPAAVAQTQGTSSGATEESVAAGPAAPSTPAATSKPAQQVRSPAQESQANSAAETAEPPAGSTRWWLWLILLAVGGGVAWIWRQRGERQAAPRAVDELSPDDGWQDVEHTVSPPRPASARKQPAPEPETERLAPDEVGHAPRPEPAPEPATEPLDMSTLDDIAGKVPTSEGEAPAPAGDENAAAKASALGDALAEGDKALSDLDPEIQHRLEVMQNSSDDSDVREARVASALLRKGQIDQARDILGLAGTEISQLPDIEDAPGPAPEPAESSPHVVEFEAPDESASSAGGAGASKRTVPWAAGVAQLQGRDLKAAVAALKNEDLPDDARRELMVAEAMLRRQRNEEAARIIQQLRDNLAAQR